MPTSGPPALLLIEPDAQWASQLREIAAPFATVSVCHDFATADRQLSIASFAFVLTNIRLAEYNGLQLIYLARDLDARCRAIAYTESREVWLARDAQRAGAFYETRDCLPVTLPVLLTASLPTSDRRDPAQPDRRSSSRLGGRRARDQHLASLREGPNS
jgi:DNA-binding NtrC family response regulator